MKICQTSWWYSGITEKKMYRIELISYSLRFDCLSTERFCQAYFLFFMFFYLKTFQKLWESFYFISVSFFVLKIFRFSYFYLRNNFLLDKYKESKGRKISNFAMSSNAQVCPWNTQCWISQDISRNWLRDQQKLA